MRWVRNMIRTLVGRRSSRPVFDPLRPELEMSVFGGGRPPEAITAGGVDISVQSGTEMAFLAKGVPAKAVAALAGPPNDLVPVVRPDLPIRSSADLKGRTMGVI
jgi:NitT/TauT family transport system substrate-binding protein